jgi:hypothetical protein
MSSAKPSIRANDKGAVVQPLRFRIFFGMRKKQCHAQPPRQMKKAFGVAVGCGFDPCAANTWTELIAREAQLGRHNPFCPVDSGGNDSVLDEFAVVLKVSGARRNVEQGDSQCPH